MRFHAYPVNGISMLLAFAISVIIPASSSVEAGMCISSPAHKFQLLRLGYTISIATLYYPANHSGC